MAIGQEEKLHGVVVLRLLEEISELFPEARFSLHTGLSRSSYVLKGRLLKEKRHLLVSKTKTAVEFSTGLFVKTSTKRMSPWRYNFTRDQQNEIAELERNHKQIFMVFVNGDDGIACMSFERFRQILDAHHEEQEWVSISRKPRATYRVKGNDGVLANPLPSNSFPKVISEYFETLISNG